MTDNFMIQVYRYFMTAVSPQEAQAAIAEGRTAMTVVEQLHAANLLGSNDTWPDFVFRGNEEELPIKIETSGSSCVLLSHGGYWSVQNRHNTMKFPRIWVSLFADTSRDLNAIPTNTSGQTGIDRVQAMYAIIDPIFHDPTNTIHRFGSIPVISTFSSEVPMIESVPGSDGVFRMLTSYEVAL